MQLNMKFPQIFQIVMDNKYHSSCSVVFKIVWTKKKVKF